MNKESNVTPDRFYRFDDPEDVLPEDAPAPSLLRLYGSYEYDADYVEDDDPGFFWATAETACREWPIIFAVIVFVWLFVVLVLGATQ